MTYRSRAVYEKKIIMCTGKYILAHNFQNMINHARSKGIIESIGLRFHNEDKRVEYQLVS